MMRLAMHVCIAQSEGMTNPTTLLLGGTGKTGRRIATRLTAAGHAVRAASRPAFDWHAPATWDAALDGATAIYIAYPPDLAAPEAAGQIRALLRRARSAERVVLLSGRGEPGVLPAEQAVRDTGLPFTILRCAWFCQNFSESFLRDPVVAGTIAFPAGATAEPFVDADDIADVAVAALTEPQHANQIYELTGPALVTFADAAAILSGVLGRAVHYVPVAPADYEPVLAQHVGPEVAAALTSLFSFLLDGHNAHLADGVQRALGRPPRSFAQYAAGAITAWQPALAHAS
jgi:uncharacterized protein YbjT (DUF2867 family)